MKKSSRRNFLVSVLGVAAATGLSGFKLIQEKKSFEEMADGPQWPLPYIALSEAEIKRVMKIAHDTFFQGGCAYGAFNGFLTVMREKVGGNFNYIPPQLIRFGKGGVIETGTLCGALTGSLAAVNLVSNKWEQISKELIHWYSQTYLPTDITNQMAINGEFDVIKYKGPIIQNKSESPLCHISVTRWCNLAKATVTSDHRKERCGRLTASTIGKAVELLNQEVYGTYHPVFKATEKTEKCLACHGPKSNLSNVLSEMSCDKCHGNPHAK